MMKERVLGMTHELALDLVYEHFKPGRIAGMIKDGEITVEEIGERFKKELCGILKKDD